MGGDDVNVVEEMQQMNLATNRFTPRKKPALVVSGIKSKISNFESVSKKSQKSEKDEKNGIDVKGSRTKSSFTQTLIASLSSSLTQTTPTPTSSFSTQTMNFSSSSSFTQTTSASTSSSFTQTLAILTMTQGTQVEATSKGVTEASRHQTASTDGDDVNVVEEMQQMNLATNRSTPGKKPTPAAREAKIKVSNFGSVASKSQMTDKE